MCRASLLLLPLGLFAASTACVSDTGLTGICGVPTRGFDIEEASSLEDAQAYLGMHDAVVFDYDSSTLPPGAGWRVRSVEILPMIPATDFDFFQDGQYVSVEIFDASDPFATPYTVTQQFFKDDHEWEDISLFAPTTAPVGTHKQSWWRFGFEGTIPTTGMVGPDYMVSVVWNDGASPPLGYSNFNRPCSANWTDYADGRGWVLNSGLLSDSECSWPMLRVNIEVLEQAVECEGERYEVEG